MAKVKEEVKEIMDSTIQEAKTEKLAIEDMPLTSLRDYRLYNEEARKINNRLKVLRYPIKQCPIELHPKQRVVFQRIDQPENALPVYLSNHLIHYDETLLPGKEYDLPECIVHYLAEKGCPVWKWFDKPDGSRETHVSHKKPRFSLRNTYNVS